MTAPIDKAKVRAARASGEGEVMTVWTTRDGTDVPIRSMGDSHLVNTIRYLRRNREGLVFNHYYAAMTYSETAPDGAADAAESGAEWLLEHADDDEQITACVAAYPALVREAKRRKLDVSPTEEDGR